MRERLLPPPSWLVVIGVLVAAVVLTVAVVAPWQLSLLTAVVALVVAAAVLRAWAAVIEVGPDALRAGGARIEWRWVADVRVLSPEEHRSWLAGAGEVRAWRLLRPWLPASVLVTLDDPADPHPCWLLSSRHPDQLAAAIAEQMKETSDR